MGLVMDPWSGAISGTPLMMVLSERSYTVTVVHQLGVLNTTIEIGVFQGML